MNKQKYVPAGNRYLREEIINSELELALDKKQVYPICYQLAATHAAGSAVACLVAYGMGANIKFLQNQVDVCCGEVACESIFTVEKLIEHLEILYSLNLSMFWATADRAENPPESQNIMTKAFGRLDVKSLQSYNRSIINVRAILEEEVIRKIMILVGAIWKNDAKDWEVDIESLLKKVIAPKLWMLTKELKKAEKSIALMLKNIRADWARDSEQLNTCEQLVNSEYKEGE